ncbi:MAG: helix-turn-helix domain-containing protein [Oscillospiraceae bacterium]|nr:helix-turn-helix domain-containing protein [Oscillospiraceae bacterium]
MNHVTDRSLEETKRHGSIWFPFNIYPCTIPGDFPSVALHWHKSMEIIYIKKGEGQVQMDLYTYPAVQGDVFVLPPGTVHAIRQKGQMRMEYENIIFELELLGLGAADLCAQQYLTPLAAGQLLKAALFSPGQEGYGPIEKALQQAELLCEYNPAGYELGVKGCMLQLLFAVLQRQPAKPVLETPSTARLKFVLQQIRQDYALPVTVEEMAGRCGLSTSHFMRWFRQMTGSSFVSYLNEYRLSEAAQLLRGSDKKILTVANETGFDSLSNFNRQFRQRYGVTPREYRKGEQTLSLH